MKMNNHSPFSRVGLKARILGVFVLVCSASLLSISLLSAGFFNGAAAQSRQQSADALKLQIQRNMEKAAVENAGIITNKLEGAAAQVELLAAHAKTLFDYPGVYGYRQSYYHDLSATPTPPTPPNRYWDSGKYGGQFVSNVTSCYLVTSGNYTGDYTRVSAQMNATIRKSSSMDYMFQSVYEAYPGFHWIYMGFQVGLHRSYPWHALTPSYDPTARTWYKTAKASPGEIIFTNPYYDASGGGLMISIARTVTMANGTFIGVVSADLTIGTIREQILDIKLSPSGYAFLINQGKNVVAHPDSLYPNETITSLEPEMPAGLFNSMVALQKGFSSFIKDGKVHYIAYAPVSASNYSMAVVVPENEVIGIVDTLTDDINAATLAITTLNFAIIIVAAVIAVILGLLIAGKMVNPINSLVKFASRLATMDIKKAQLQPDAFRIDAQLESQNDEIGDLTRAFKSMVVSLQKEKDSEKNKPDNKQPQTS
jgi:HAMP domain-containing protein